MNKKIKTIYCIMILIALAFNLSFAAAIAEFQVTSFSCSPSEVVISNSFSCSATISNIGTNGSTGSVTLYSEDGNAWFTPVSAPSVDIAGGSSATLVFNSISPVKSGNNGFSKIMIDQVADLYVYSQNKRVNVINIDVALSNSASSAVMGRSVTTTAEVTAGGNIDVSLSFSSSSGGCSIGSQINPKTIIGMTDGSKQTRAWTITQGTSGSCVFSISAAATGTGGVASKIYSVPSTITCTDCPTDSTTTSSSSSGGAGGAGSGAGGGETIFTIGNLDSAYTQEMSINEKLKFNISNSEHTLTVINVTDIAAVIEIESKKQTFTLKVGETISIDLNEDSAKEISVFLKSINALSKKATFIITPLGASNGRAGEGGEETGKGEKDDESFATPIIKSKYVVFIIIGIIAIAAVIYLVFHLFLNKYEISRFKKSVKVKEWN